MAVPKVLGVVRLPEQLDQRQAVGDADRAASVIRHSRLGLETEGVQDRGLVVVDTEGRSLT